MKNERDEFMNELSAASQRIIAVLSKVPHGKVASYGQIAALADVPLGARSVVRVLHSCSDKYALPWHRILRSNGEIALGEDAGRTKQKVMMQEEGVKFISEFRVDMTVSAWNPMEDPLTWT
ncbi:MAG: MGMT family protein [Candidatus Cloacimonadaceae bacterium]|nr:MGMT family protein [Candidatus Cloacimonadaceae bacterium]